MPSSTRSMAPPRPGTAGPPPGSSRSAADVAGGRRQAASGSAGRTSPSTVGLNGSRLRASWPHWAGSGRLDLTPVERGPAELAAAGGVDGLPAGRDAEGVGQIACHRRLSSGASVCAPAPLWVIACRTAPGHRHGQQGGDAHGAGRSPATVTRPGRRRTRRCCPGPSAARRPGRAAHVGHAVAGVQEALGAEPVVDGHAHDAVAGEGAPSYSATEPDPFMNEPP